MIILVIETGQVKNAMERKDFHLIWKRVPDALRVFPCNIGGDGYVAGNALACRENLHPVTRKRQDIRGFVCSSESLIKGSYFRAVRY